MISEELADGLLDEDVAIAELHDDPDVQAMLDERLAEWLFGK